MKIGIYKDTFANNRGADIAVKNLAEGLTGRGHDVTLFDKSRFETEIRDVYDVIVSAGTNEILDLAKLTDLPPIIQQFHTDPGYPFRHRFRRWLRNRAIKAALRKASAYQVLSPFHIASLQGILSSVEHGRIFVIGNWSLYEGAATESSPERKFILCPGAINKDKNQKLLVDAYAKVVSEFPDWQVHIYGQGSPKQEKSLTDRISACGLSDRILLKGYADLSDPYSKCAFVAFPSKTEGFGLAILDAAMYSKPSLMIHDWLGCGEVSEPVNFAASLRRLMSDADYRHALGERSRIHCMQHYSRQKILDEWESLIYSVARHGERA